jgi:peptidoglycan/xylan/chitin deacetylase (PgdA/CDA1 family)
MKSVMYHYVREHDETLPNLRYLDFDNFRKQLDYFEQEYGFVEKDEWDKFVGSGIYPARGGKVLLTFDDAMKCQYEFVYPELQKRGLWGIFFIPTLPYTEKKLLDVHRIHLLCGAFNGEDLYAEAMDRINDEMIPDSKKAEFRNETYTTQRNHMGITEFKRLLNYYIDYEFRKGLIDELGEVFSYSFETSRFYMQEYQLKQMFDGGMVIGSHTVSHPVMSKLSREGQRNQIVKSFAALDSFGVVGDKVYSHPYGGFHSFNDETISILDEEGISYSFNVEARDITPQDYDDSIQFLPRYDCIMFAHGKDS